MNAPDTIVVVMPHGTTLGTVGELHRFPVKSLGGERPTSVLVEPRGVVGDRTWAVVDADGRLGSGKTSRRFRRMEGLLELEARYDVGEGDGGDVPVLTFPGGRRLSADDPAVHEALSSYVGRPVTLESQPGASYFDDGPFHLVTTASLARLAEAQGQPLDPRRARANVVVDSGDRPPLAEDALDGCRIAIGPEVIIEVASPMPRCVMLDLALVDEPAVPGVLRTLHQLTGGELGVLATVVRGGAISLGDSVIVAD